VRATTLSPMQYHSYQTARGTKTADFIGDLALSFALNQTAGTIDNSRMHRGYPDYKEDLKDKPYLATVFKPENTEHLAALTRITRKGADWELSDRPANIAGVGGSGSTFSGYFQTQCIAPGSTFLGTIFTKKENVPDTVRVGNQKQCLLKLEEIDEKEIDDLWVNLFTLDTVLGMDEIEQKERMKRRFIIEKYDILEGVDLEIVKGWYQE